MPRLTGLVLALATLAGLGPAQTLAQIKAGVVTNLEGTATAARTVLPQALALKFKDDVFQNDRIVTGDRSIVRMLLGGKAVVTVRERSSLTITEVPGKSTIDLDNGKIAVAVAKERMRPGESLEVKTPNAVAAVRGTAFIIEVLRATAPGPGAQSVSDATTNAYTFSGVLDLNFFLSHQTFAVAAGYFAGGTGGGLATSAIMTALQALNAQLGLHLQNLTLPNGGTGAKEGALGATQALAALGMGGGLPPGGNVPPVPTGFTLPQPPINACQNGGCTPAPPSQGVGTVPAESVTPDSLAAGLRPLTSPAFGGVVSGGLVTDQYKGFGLLFGPGQVAIFSDPPLAWAGVNRNGNVDLLSPVGASFVMPGTTTPASTNRLVVEAGFAAPGTITLEAFGAGGALLGAMVNGNTTGPHGRSLIELDLAGIRSFLVSGPTDTFGVDEVDIGAAQDPPAVLTLNGPLTRSVNEQRSAVSTFFDMADQAIVGQGPDPLIWLTGSTWRTVRQFAVLDNSQVSAAGSFVRLDGGSQIIQTSMAEPLVSLRGGTLAVGTAGAGHLFDLAGRPGNTQVDGDTGLTLGTDQPLQPGVGSPVLAATNGAVVTVAGSAYRVDTALLKATAPLIAMAAGSSLTTSGHTVDLVNRAKVAIPNDAVAMLSLNGSVLNVNNANLVNVAGGSQLSVAGSLLSLSGGSTLSILNGLLLNVTGGSSARVGHALVSFGGPGNLLSVTNHFVPTAILGGVPVYGPVGSFQITSPSALAGLGTWGTIKINGVALTSTTPLSSLTGSLVAVQGSGRVKVGN